MRRSLVSVILFLTIGGPIALGQVPTTELPPQTNPPAMAVTPPESRGQVSQIVAATVTPNPTPNPTPTPVVEPQTRAPGDIVGIITKWANHYGVDPSWLIRVAQCESRLNPSAINLYYSDGGNPTGLFQFVPPTFYANAERAGISDPYIWNIEHQSQTAAYMFSIGQHVQWECK